MKFTPSWKGDPVTHNLSELNMWRLPTSCCLQTKQPSSSCSAVTAWLLWCRTHICTVRGNIRVKTKTGGKGWGTKLVSHEIQKGVVPYLFLGTQNRLCVVCGFFFYLLLFTLKALHVCQYYYNPDEKKESQPIRCLLHICFEGDFVLSL